jgi:hypothetical protein
MSSLSRPPGRTRTVIDTLQTLYDPACHRPRTWPLAYTTRRRTVRRHDHARTDLLELRGLLVRRGFHARTVLERGGGQAADPAADDRGPWHCARSLILLVPLPDLAILP